MYFLLFIFYIGMFLSAFIDVKHTLYKMCYRNNLAICTGSSISADTWLNTEQCPSAALRASLQPTDYTATHFLCNIQTWHTTVNPTQCTYLSSTDNSSKRKKEWIDLIGKYDKDVLYCVPTQSKLNSDVLNVNSSCCRQGCYFVFYQIWFLKVDTNIKCMCQCC